jgi:late competence protein required for DNA uptake (superfamily II DNA/RNA helicase)
VRDSRTIILHHQDGPFAARPSLQQLHKRKKLGAASVFLVTARRTSKLRNGWVSQQVVMIVLSVRHSHTPFLSPRMVFESTIVCEIVGLEVPGGWTPTSATMEIPVVP